MARTKKMAVVEVPQHPDLPFTERAVEPVTRTATTPDFQAQLAELTATVKRLEDNNQTLQRTNMALMGQGIQQNQPPQFGPTEVSLENLPDPVTNPKEYAGEILKRGQQVLQTQRAADNWEAEQRQTLQDRLDGIWAQFGDAYPDLASKPDLVEAAATKAVAEARRQGIDPNKYMFAATPQFFSDTAQILEGWGIKGGAEDGDETEGADEAPMRTAGIPGGIESSGRVAAKAEPTAMPSLKDEVMNWKLKGGWY